MHRRVLGLASRGTSGRWQADHVNRDKLDNRKANLRIVSQGENEQNKTRVLAGSGYRNVAFDRQRQAFFARVTLRGKQHVRGYFATAEEAAIHAADLRRLLHKHAPT